jgi:hypothetical protein
MELSGQEEPRAPNASTEVMAWAGGLRRFGPTDNHTQSLFLALLHPQTIHQAHPSRATADATGEAAADALRGGNWHDHML